MKIYFAAATSFGRKYLKQCTQIIQMCKQSGHKILSEHIVDPKLQRKKKWMKDWDAKKLYQRERKRVRQSDFVITEVSSPSWGVGMLTEYALSLGKPVLALCYKDHGAKLSVMIQGNPELYTESYDEHNIKAILEQFFAFMAKKINQKGRLIVVEGSDGSGKGTQAKMLIKYLKSHRVKHKLIDFPRYYTSFYGKMVGRFLKGDFGSLKEVNPYLASLTYALDRLAAKHELIDWLADKNLVVANRYVPSALAFQSVRVPKKEQDKFTDWLYEMEYKQHRLPKEDLVIFLHVPVKISQKLLDKKARAKSRRYTGGKKKDINEANVAYQKKVLKKYLEFASKYRHWQVIDCVNSQGEIMSKKAIHDKIINLLVKKGVLPRT